MIFEQSLTIRTIDPILSLDYEMEDISFPIPPSRNGLFTLCSDSDYKGE